MARVKWRKDEAKRKIPSTLSASGGGRETLQAEAQAWESVWEKFDAAPSHQPNDPGAEGAGVRAGQFTGQGRFRELRGLLRVTDPRSATQRHLYTNSSSIGAP